MKYEAVIETDDYRDFEFFEDGNGKYIHGIDAGAENNEWIALYFKECKQESMLDKIRAEILATIGEERIGNGNINKGVVIGVQMALDIIDKHISGKE